MAEDEIKINKFIVHILDGSVGMPVLSDNEHPINNEISDFILTHIKRVLKDPELKNAIFKDGENIVWDLLKTLKDDHDQFIGVTRRLSEILFKLMQQNVNIPAADIVFSLVDIENKDYLAILKFNYKSCYIHQIENLENKTTNNIIKHRTTLPNENQKIDECILIDINNELIKLIEKKFEIEGEKQFYLSTLFLKCTSDISAKEKIKVMEKTADQIIKKYYSEGNLEKKFEFKQAINEHLEDALTVNVEEVASKVFGKIPEVKENYIQQIEKKGVTEKEIIVNTEPDQSLYKKQRILTDTGIEINLPVNEYQNKEKVEFINNPDGTISILLKNIKKLT